MKGLQKMAELNHIEWGGINEKIPFKGSEIYSLADEITRFVGFGWKGASSDPILDFSHRDLLTCDAMLSFELPGYYRVLPGNYPLPAI